MQNVESFYNELTPILEQIKESPEAFLEGTEVSKVTLWRWTNGINRKFPDPYKLLSVLSKISGKITPNEIANHFGGEIEKYLHSAVRVLSSENMQLKIRENQNDFFKDFQSWIIFVLCETEAGCSKEDLIYTLANLALKKLGLSEEDASMEFLKSYSSIVERKISELESLGALELGTDGKYHSTFKDILYSHDIIIKYYPELISNYARPNEAYRGFTFCYGFQQSIPEELIKEINKEMKEFYSGIYEKMNRSRCKGGIPFQIIGFTDKLIFERNESNFIGVQ